MELDKLLSGLQNSELLILAARPSQGKTALALNLAENIAIRAQQPVAIFSLEMSKESLLQRLVASVAQIDAHKFRTGHLNKDDWRRMTDALGTISSSPISVDDAGQGVEATGSGLPTAHYGAGKNEQPAGRSVEHFAITQRVGEGIKDS